LLASLSFALRCAAACEPSAPVERMLTPDQVLQTNGARTGSILLLEEFGADVEYSWHDGEAFVAIDTPPGRLGFAVLTSGSASLSLRLKSGHGAGRAQLSDCANAGDALFCAQLAELHTASLRGGTESARGVADGRASGAAAAGSRQACLGFECVRPAERRPADGIGECVRAILRRLAGGRATRSRRRGADSARRECVTLGAFAPAALHNTLP
jgi:hypothetical protein